MQLENPPKPPSALRDALHTAALALLLVPAAAHAQTADQPDRVDVTSLFYGEQGRTSVVEPVVRFTHFLPDGQSFAAQLGVDVITGASPTGALPSGQVQTHTTPSGRTVTSPAGQIPTAPFNDRRVALDGEWQKPWGRVIRTDVGGHFSREKDYQSLGVNGKFSTDLMHRLLTITIGGGVNRDTVFPIGGTTAGLSNGAIISTGTDRKNVNDVFVGVSRILTRRWMLSLTGEKTNENGYLTEPYKLVSVMNRSGVPIDDLTEKRPSTRDRSSVMLSSVYHLTSDVFYSSYRFYRDSWDIRSHTLDLKYRHDFDQTTWIEPLFRFYTQSAARFYTAGLIQGNTLPDFATSDYRLGDLTTFTLGATYGFRFEDLAPGDWTVRAQIIRQAGNSSPPNAIGIQRRFDLSPPLNIYAVVIGYSFGY